MDFAEVFHLNSLFLFLKVSQLYCFSYFLKVLGNFICLKKVITFRGKHGAFRYFTLKYTPDIQKKHINRFPFESEFIQSNIHAGI